MRKIRDFAKPLFCTLILSSILVVFAQAGRPIFLSKEQACAQADLVVIGTVGESRRFPEEDVFSDPRTDGRFELIAEIKDFRVLSGDPQSKLSICGGKLGTGTDYKLEKGDFLLLLKKVGDGLYRAVDWNHSFMPVKDGKVEWKVATDPKDIDQITVDEALARIKAHGQVVREAGKQD